MAGPTKYSGRPGFGAIRDLPVSRGGVRPARNGPYAERMASCQRRESVSVRMPNVRMAPCSMPTSSAALNSSATLASPQVPPMNAHRASP